MRLAITGLVQARGWECIALWLGASDGQGMMGLNRFLIDPAHDEGYSAARDSS